MLEVKFNGKEPDVVLGFFKNNDGQMLCNCKGTGIELMVALTMIITALKERFPKGLVNRCIKGTEDIPFDGIILDVEELKKQSGK